MVGINHTSAASASTTPATYYLRMVLSVSLLTVATHVHDVLCVLHNIVHQMSRACDQTRTAIVERYPLLLVRAFHARVYVIAFSKFHMTSSIRAYYVRNKGFLSYVISVSQFRIGLVC